MKKLSILFTLFLVSAFFISCKTIMNTSFSEIEKNAGQEIVAESSETGFLWLSVPDTYSLERIALENFRSQCSGKIVNTTTRLEMRNFLLFQSYTLRLTGMCAK